MLNLKLVSRMLLLGSVAVLFITLQLLPSQSFRRMADAEGWVRHTLLVLDSSEQVLSSLEAAGSSERNYLLAGDVQYVQAFQSSLSSDARARLKLRTLTIDNSAQQARIEKLDRLVTARLATLTQTMALYRAEGPKAAALGNGQARQANKDIRDILAEISGEEYRLLNVRNKKIEAEAGRLKWTLRTGGASLIVLLVAFGAVSARDIRAQQRSEKLAIESEEQFHTLANAIPQLCWIAHGDGEIFWYNQRWYDLTGTTLKKMQGLGWQSVHDPEALPIFLKDWKAAIKAEEPFEMIFPLRAADGVFHPFLTRVMPVRGPNGRVTRWFGTNTDITAQRMTEDALRENNEQLRLAHEVAQIGTFEWDLKTGDKRRTPELEAMYGLPPGGFDAGQEIGLNSICLEDRERVRVVMEQAMDSGHFEAEWRLVWPNGEEHWHLGRGASLRMTRGSPRA